MTETASPRLSRLIRDTEGLLLPLTEMADDVAITRVEFGFDLPKAPTDSSAAPHTVPHTASPAEAAGRASLAGTVVLATEPVRSPAGLDAVLSAHAGAAALV